MRKFRFYQWALVALMASALAACGVGVGPGGAGTATGAGGSTGTLAGVVTNISNGAAISGAKVTLGRSSTTTDSTGAYSFSVATGTAPAYVSATGYQTTSQNVTINTGSTTTNNFEMTAAYGTQTPPANSMNYVLFAWNNLGMHCDQNDYSAFCVLPPYNILVAELINRNTTTNPITSGVTVSYYLYNKQNPSLHTNFWNYVGQFCGTNAQGVYSCWSAAQNVGITGNGPSGNMVLRSDNLSWTAAGLPATPYDDDGTWDPYGYAIVNATDNTTGALLATVKAETPVSTEMDCMNCHGTSVLDPTLSPQASILYDHDTYNNGANGTHLYTDYQSGKVHLCGECHEDNALGTTNQNGATTDISTAMHSFHAGLMNTTTTSANTSPDCFNCHPGPKTQCLRGIMARAGKSCHDCHGDMTAMGNPNRQPWTAGSLPKCATCHDPKYYTENSNTLYQNSLLNDSPNNAMNGKLYCEACHNGTHAELMTTATPSSLNNADSNLPEYLQGDNYWIHACTICHPNKSGYVHH